MILWNIDHLFAHSLNVFKYCYLSPVDPQLTISTNSKIKEVWVLFCHKSKFKNTFRTVLSVLGLDISSGLGFSDYPFRPIRAKVECCRSLERFGYRIMHWSTTRIPSQSITGQHPRSTSFLIVCVCGGGLIPLQKCSRCILLPPNQQSV